MATFMCLHHRPEEPHYRAYARPLAHLELPCGAEACTHHARVWLDPEEARDYERGSRLFCDADFNMFRVDDGGLRDLEPALRLPRSNFRPLRNVFQPFYRSRKKGVEGAKLR